MESDILYHIKVNKNENLPRYLITCGDPGRAKWISDEFLEKSRELSKNREYWSFLGEYKGVEIIISSMGIGSPSTAIGLEEFSKCGVDTFIRVGTSGSLQKSIPVGSIVNATGAIRDEGTSKQYIPLEFPAIASVDVVLAIREASKLLNLKSVEGLVHSKDAFYMEHPEYTAIQNEIREKWSAWQKGNALATEMECAILFILGQMRGWRTGSILAVIGNTWNESPISNNHKIGIKEAIQTSLEAIVQLNKLDKNN